MLKKETFIKREKVEQNVERMIIKTVYFNTYILSVRIMKEINL